jgi:hypothetical protein
MKRTMPFWRCAFFATVVLIFVVPNLDAQGRGARGRGGPPPTAKQAAPIDITGYWVSLITEDWRWRMLTPPKGSYPSVPLNAEGKRIANSWDPAKDEAAGEQCKGYGIGNIMRLPGRLHITWQDDNVLRIDIDAGTQTRLLYFKPSEPPAGEPSWQGSSAAQWEIGGGQNGIPRGGDLKVVTTHMRPGYLQKNGVPYSGNAVISEYFHTTKEPNGDQWLILETLVDDPTYLAVSPDGSPGDNFGPFIRSTSFKKQPDASGWNLTPCSAR